MIIKQGYNVYNNKLTYADVENEETVCGIWENGGWKIRPFIRIMKVLSPEDFAEAAVQPYEGMDKWMTEHVLKDL